MLYCIPSQCVPQSIRQRTTLGQVPSEPNFFRTAYNVFGVDRLVSVKVQLHMETEWRLCLNSMIKHIFVLHAQSLIQR